MDPHITDWLNKTSQVPWSGNQPVYQFNQQLIYCYNNANFTIALLSEDNFFNMQSHSARPTYLFNFYLSKIVCKRHEVNSEPTHFLTLMKNGKAFCSLDGIACSSRCSDQFQFLPGHWQAKKYWISWDLK